jgi:hypothetical protein
VNPYTKKKLFGSSDDCSPVYVPEKGDVVPMLPSNTSSVHFRDRLSEDKSKSLNLIASAAIRGNGQGLAKNENGDIGIAVFNDSVVVSELDLSETKLSKWNQYILADPELFGDDISVNHILKNQKVGRSDYPKQKIATFQQFLKILRVHDRFRIMVELVEDPDKEGTFLLLLFKLLRGLPDMEKKVLLNSILTFFFFMFKPIDPSKSEYQPNVCEKHVRHLFSVFKDNGMFITANMLKTLPGSFHAYLEAMFNKEAKLDADYGRRKNRAMVDHDWQYKLHHSADPPLDPFNNYKDCLTLSLLYSGIHFALRNEEVSFPVFGLLLDTMF